MSIVGALSATSGENQQFSVAVGDSLDALRAGLAQFRTECNTYLTAQIDAGSKPSKKDKKKTKNILFPSLFF